MQLSLLPLLGGVSLASSASITLRLPSPPSLPNPNALPPTTHATLTTLRHPSYSAPLSTANTFVFHNVSAGSYLADVHCATFAFTPLRVDVTVSEADGKEEQGVVSVWETFRGNDWDNKGEALAKDALGGYVVRTLGVKNYFVERSKFSILSILKNPMILLGLVSCALFMGMPKLVENMDPEMKAEWEERQKSNPMNGIMGAASGQPGANPMQNFDMASFLAGSSSSKRAADSPAPAAASTPAGAAGSYADVVKSDAGAGSGGGGGGKRKGKR